MLILLIFKVILIIIIIITTVQVIIIIVSIANTINSDTVNRQTINSLCTTTVHIVAIAPHTHFQYTCIFKTKSVRFPINYT